MSVLDRPTLAPSLAMPCRTKLTATSVNCRYEMTWSISYKEQIKRMAILVSKQDHCLYDLLIRHKAGELRCEIPLVISNHPDLQEVAEGFGIGFRHLSIDPNLPGEAWAHVGHLEMPSTMLEQFLLHASLCAFDSKPAGLCLANQPRHYADLP